MKDNLIRRQAAIDVVKRLMGDSELSRTVQTGLYILPSAWPEIIRCKDCKHSEHWYRDRRRCFLWYEDGIGVFEDGFCNYAERRSKNEMEGADDD